MSRDPSLRRPVLGRHARLALAVTALATVVATAAVPAGPTAADDGAAATGVTATGPAVADCPPGLARVLRSAGDRFGAGCDLAGGELAAMDDSRTRLREGEVAMSDNVELVANVPKQGPFEGEGSYNSDLAFQGDHAYAGNYDGFTVYDISDPAEPEVLTQVVCAGSQNDVSVLGDLLVLSVDSSRSDDSCTSSSQTPVLPTSWEGVRVFDISDPAEPEYVADVETACGSHTHTLAPTASGRAVFVYVSSYGPDETYADCKPPHDKISVVRIRRDDPASARLVGTPVLFPDGGNPGGNGSSATSGCHDITAYPALDVAAGACMGDGILMDISRRRAPQVTEQVRDTRNFAFWHSATFSDSGRKVVFTDELGGGGAPTCNPSVGEEKGADAIYKVTRKGALKFQSYYKIPRTNSNTENCVAHNGSLVPVEGKDVMVQAWYQGGISVFDFTRGRQPEEIGWFDRGPISEEELVLGGSWSAYWYRGHIFSNDIQQGLDVLRIRDPRLRPLRAQPDGAFNAQSQPSLGG